MKHIIILIDGMADQAYKALNNKSPIQAADTPTLDAWAKGSQVGLVKTIPEGLPASSDVANLGLLGYDPLVYHRGRSGFEATYMGLDLEDENYLYRCNLITLSDHDCLADKVIIDPSGGMIAEDQGRQLMEDLIGAISPPYGSFYANKAYKHMWSSPQGTYDSPGPHDLLGRPIKELELGPWQGFYEAAHDFLDRHPINKDRQARGLLKANGLWVWGKSQVSNLPSFKSLYHKKALLIGSTELILGMAQVMDMDWERVPSGDLKAKGQRVIDRLAAYDFIYLHLEEGDEASHAGLLEKKVQIMSDIDKEILGPLNEHLGQEAPYRVMVLPDHYTPVSLRSHLDLPVPYLIHDSNQTRRGILEWGETIDRETGQYYSNGPDLLKAFLEE